MSGRMRNALTPECENLSKSLKLTSLITLVLTSIATILLLVAIIYNYVKRSKGTTRADAGTSNSTDEEKTAKIVGALSISGSVAVALTFLLKIWDFTVAAKTAKTCLATTNQN